MTRVLMFGWEFPPHNSGGLGIACYDIAQALAKEKVDVIFVLPRKVDVLGDGFKIVFANVPNIKIRSIDSLLYPYVTSDSYNKYLAGLSLNHIYGFGLFEEVLRYAKLARGVAESEEFDVIHAHDWLSFLAGVEAKRVSGKSLVAHVHATEFDRSGGNINQNVYEIEKRGLMEADSIIAVSEFTKNILVSKYSIDPNKVNVVYNGINIEKFPTKEAGISQVLKLKEAGNNIVLHLGRITFQKGPDYFIKAAKKVLEYLPNTYFIVSGTGDMENQIIKQAAYLGIGNRVLFYTGAYTNEKDRMALFHSADLYVLSSVSEPFGIVPLESLAYGTPALISKQSGVSEVLSNTLKVDFWDTDEMANKIIAVLKHEPLKNTLIKNGRKEVFGISWKKAAQKCVNIYNKIIKPILFEIKK